MQDVTLIFPDFGETALACGPNNLETPRLSLVITALLSQYFGLPEYS